MNGAASMTSTSWRSKNSAMPGGQRLLSSRLAAARDSARSRRSAYGQMCTIWLVCPISVCQKPYILEYLFRMSRLLPKRRSNSRVEPPFNV